MRYVLKADRVITPDDDLSPGWVLVRDGTIEAVGAGGAPEDIPETDLGELTLLPGFVDIHVHGGGGFSLMTADPEEIRAYARWVVAHGVTSILPTVVAADTSQGLAFLRAVAAATGPVDGGAEVLAANLEGPFVSEKYRGALPKSWLKSPEADLIDVFADAAHGQLCLITIAPELDDNKLIRRAVGRGIRVAVGHSGASYTTGLLAFNAGASHVTHLYNAMRYHHRDPGIVGAAFDHPDVTVELVADGIHIEPVVVEMTIRLFGSVRIALVSDGVPPAGATGGRFRLGEEQAHLMGDRVVLEDGTLAGGAATMDQLLRNVVWWKCATLPEAARMASTVPTSVAGAGERKGRIAPGYDADLVALTDDMSVAATWVGGRLVHDTPSLHLTG
jgi:N-acetylglucosamine-6-phosphate deacetylase